jgi:hypothetical protein
MWLSVGMDAALLLGPTNFLINSTSDVVKYWDGCRCCLGTDKFFNQLHPNPTLLGNGSDVVERWDGWCTCPWTDNIF